MARAFRELMKKLTVRRSPKLELKRETIKLLTHDQLSSAAGGLARRCTGGASGCAVTLDHTDESKDC